MSYYNNVFVVFEGHEGMDGYRTAGQCLPSGAVPIAIINGNTKTYTEVINTASPGEVFDFIESCIENDDIPEEMKKELFENLSGEYEYILS